MNNVSSSSSASTVALRHALRSCLEGVEPGAPIIVGCSGGPDSLALVAVAVWVAAHEGRAVISATIDHQLQSGSAEIARRAQAACISLGVDEAVVIPVEVDHGDGLEAGARAARLSALAELAESRGAAAVLLGHTRDDQAETVLLRLSRGAGARSLGAMRTCAGIWHRPFLDQPRAVVHEAAAEALAPLGLEPWSDPHNDSADFARVRIRALLADLTGDLGPGVVMGLIRSAELLRDDDDVLASWSAGEYGSRVIRHGDALDIEIASLTELPRAVRSRLIRLMYEEIAGVDPSSSALSFDHVRAIDALIVDWHGQGHVDLPGGIRASRAYERLTLLRGKSRHEPREQ